MDSIRVLAKKTLGDPYYEPTTVVHDISPRSVAKCLQIKEACEI